MARVRAKPIYRPQIVAAHKEWVGRFLIVLLVLAPWLLSAGSPWLARVPLPQPRHVPSQLDRQAEALRQELGQLRQRSQALIMQIAQLELDLRIDRHANDLAAEQIRALRFEHEQLSQNVADLRQLLGANATLIPVHDSSRLDR